MAKRRDFQKEWEKLKKQLAEYGKEAMVIAKKGEKEFKRVSKEGKLRLDAATLNLKQEQLYYNIGKEYVKARCPGPKNAKLKKLTTELKNIIRQKSSVNRKIKGTIK